MLSDVLTREMIVVKGASTTHHDAIREAGELLVNSGAVTPEYIDAMYERDRQISTFMGNWLAIPHGTNEAKGAITRPAMCLIRYDNPLDWHGEDVRVVVGIAGAGDEHLEMLSKVAILFSDLDDVERLLAAKDADEIMAQLLAIED